MQLSTSLFNDSKRFEYYCTTNLQIPMILDFKMAHWLIRLIENSSKGFMFHKFKKLVDKFEYNDSTNANILNFVLFKFKIVYGC